MSRQVFETRSAKLIAAVAVVLFLMVIQVAVQAKPAHAYEVRIQISGGGKVTETTRANLVGSNCFTSSQTPTGIIGKTCLAGTPGGDYGAAWDVDYTATPADGFTFARWESDGSARTAIICDRSSPAATAPTYTGPVCKFRTFEDLQTRAVFVDNQAPSSPSISGTTPQFTNQAVSFSFSTFSDSTFRRFECRVTPTVQTSFQPCSSGVSVNPTTDGTYTFEVRAVDWSGNTSFSNSRSWTVDKTASDVTLDPASGPAPGSTLESNSGEFRFSSTDAQATFECRRYTTGASNPPAFSACTSPAPFAGLNDGRYTFEVRSVDRAGNRSATASRSWTISNAPRVDSGTLSPAKGETGVLRNANVQATFTEAMHPGSLTDPFTFKSTTFKLQMYIKKTKKWKAVPATVALSNGDKTATLNPYGDATTLLGANKKFKATITTGARDAAGNPMATNFVWTFNTGSVVG